MTSDKIDIILVEDNPDDAELTTRALRKTGITNSLIHLKDGEEALDFIFCKGPWAGRNCDHLPKLILLDLKMPKVDGIEVLRQVKSDERTRMIPVVLLTSSNEERDIVRSYQTGVNSYVVKPVEFESFIRTVSDMGLYWLLHNRTPH
jgi:two-component system, response regulator